MFEPFVYCKLREQTLVTHSVFGLHHQTIPWRMLLFGLCCGITSSITELFHVETPVGYSQGTDTFLKKAR
jgi:hypothetical protein